MKITDVEVYVVDPTQGSLTYNEEPQNVWTFVRVLTDAGVHGWGESTNFPANGSLIVADAIRHLRPWIVGQDAADITAMWHRLFRKATYLGPRGLPTAVVSGIDIALWDIKGKVAGQPVYDLLGGKVRDSVPLYANGWFAALDGQPACATPEDYAAAARRVVDRGHVAVKLDPFHEMVPYHTGYLAGQISAAGEEFGVACVAAIREAVGPAVEILIDAHGHYNVPTAVRLARRLEPYRIGWLEEPTPPESLEALRAVREQVSVPICVGERLYTRWDFLPVLAGAAGGLPDAGRRLDRRDQRGDADRRPGRDVPHPRDAAQRDGPAPDRRRRPRHAGGAELLPARAQRGERALVRPLPGPPARPPRRPAPPLAAARAGRRARPRVPPSTSRARLAVVARRQAGQVWSPPSTRST